MLGGVSTCITKTTPTADIEMNKQCSPSRPLDKSVN